MDDREFLEKIISERIAVLAGVRDMEQREQELMKDYDVVLEDLDGQTEQRIHAQVNRMIDKIIETEREAYYAGVKDGIKLAKWGRCISCNMCQCAREK